MNQIRSQFADNSPIFQQAIVEHLHHWGFELTPVGPAGVPYAPSITRLPFGNHRPLDMEQNLLARLAHERQAH